MIYQRWIDFFNGQKLVVYLFHFVIIESTLKKANSYFLSLHYEIENKTKWMRMNFILLRSHNRQSRLAGCVS